MSPKALVFFATAWGSRHGGINVVNFDLCVAVAQALPSHKVVCAVSEAEALDVEDARSRGIELLQIPEAERGELDIASALQRLSGYSVEWWIGHDAITGRYAFAAREAASRGRVAIIKHMSYIAYYGRKPTNSTTLARHKDQRESFEKADQVFAIGPKLTDAAQDITQRVAVELVPGLPAIEPSVGMPHRLSCITFGRLADGNAVIKQPRLAVAGLAAAVRRYSAVLSDLRTDPTMLLVGAEPGEKVVAELTKLAFDHAGRAINLVVAPYSESRSDLFALLREQSVCLMLSIHDGFGLTGWEAIAAEVPLILSENTGLHHLISRALGGKGTGCIKTIDVKGTPDADLPNAADIDAVAEAISEIVINKDLAKRNARDLKAMLVDKFTWKQAADTFVRGCGLIAANTVGTAILPQQADNPPVSFVPHKATSATDLSHPFPVSPNHSHNPQHSTLKLNKNIVLSKCDYFVDVHLWPRKNKLDPRSWLSNFREEELDVAIHLLNSFIYFSDELTNEMAIATVHSLSSELSSQPNSDIGTAWAKFVDTLVLVNMTTRPDETSGLSSRYTISAEVRSSLGVNSDRTLAHSSAIRYCDQAKPGDMVLLDDFVGSGDSFVTAWRTAVKTDNGDFSLADMAIRNDRKFFYCPLICTKRGYENISANCGSLIVRPAHIVSPRDSPLDANSYVWPSHYRGNAAEVIRLASIRAGVPEDGLFSWRGSHDLGLTIAFAHLVPRATLPLFYWESTGWHPLIRRL